MTEDGRQMTEDGGQRTEDGGQRADDGGQRSEAPKFGIGNAECGMRNAERKDWNVEGGNHECGLRRKAHAVRTEKDAIRLSTLNPEP
jgi:hypothetical protein